MKFGFKYRLMNEASEVEPGGSAGEVVNEIANVNEFGEVSAESLVKDLGLDPQKYFNKEEQTEETGVVEENQEAAAPQEESAILEEINKLGAIWNGQPVSISSKDELKNIIQQGMDYTKKTQALSEERKVWDSEKVQVEETIKQSIGELNASIEKHQQELAELEQWKFAIEQIKNEAPDIFEEMQNRYNGVKSQFSNPIIQQQIKALRDEMEPLKKELQQSKNQEVLKSFESDWEGIKAVEQSLKELGINVDKEAVKKEWANTGLPVSRVIGALYGEQVIKAQASKAKVATVQKKVANKPTGAAATSRPGGKVPNTKGMSYLEAAQQYYNSL